MENRKFKGVFFDCWSTVISFNEARADWNTAPLKRHAKNFDELDWNIIDKFSDSFFKTYYATTSYDIKYIQFLELVSRTFSIELDDKISNITHEVLEGLDPKPIQGIQDFVKYLNANGYFCAILSNTIYEDIDSIDTLKKIVPECKFNYFYGSANCGVKKPDSLFFECGAKPSNIPLSQAMYIGDTFYQDVYGSYKAGFKYSIWLNTRNKERKNYTHLCDVDEPKYIEVKNYYELLELFKEGRFDDEIR